LVYVYENTLLAVMQDYVPRVFDVFQNINESNIAITLASIGFIALIIGSVLSIIYAILASFTKQIWTGPRIIRIWNPAGLSLFGVILFSCPTLYYINNELVKVTAFIGAQYHPVFEGFGIGFFITWVSVVLALISGQLFFNSVKIKPPQTPQQQQIQP